jgi:hypothetical protein
MAPHNHRLPLLLALASVALIHGPGVARADDPPPPPNPYQVQPGGPPVYVAPLSQETQTTYVPQSVALSGPEELRDYDESRPPPAGYTAVFRKRRGLIVGGGVTFGVSYGISAFVASIGEDSSGGGRNTVAAMWIPVAGPFIELTDTDNATGRFFLVGLGAAQAAGAIMLYYGLTTHKRVFVRNDLVGNLAVTPMAGAGVSGMMLSGSF